VDMNFEVFIWSLGKDLPFI